MSFTEDMEKMLRSYEEISRDENGCGETVSDWEILLDSYKKVPREEQKKTAPAQEKADGDLKEIKAIQDMRRVLYFLEKKVRGTFTEADKQEVKDSREQWEDSMELLRRYAEGK